MPYLVMVEYVLRYSVNVPDDETPDAQSAQMAALNAVGEGRVQPVEVKVTCETTTR